jgi:hypothetical protein
LALTVSARDPERSFAAPDHSLNDDRNIPMTKQPVTQLNPGYLRLQADRFRSLSSSCVDLGTARDLRLMAEEYSGEACRMKQRVTRRELH